MLWGVCLQPCPIFLYNDMAPKAKVKAQKEASPIKKPRAEAGVKPKPSTKTPESDTSADDSANHLHGFSTDDDDSSDDDAAEPSALDVATLPTIAKDDAAVKQKLDKAKRQPVRPQNASAPSLQFIMPC